MRLIRYRTDFQSHVTFRTGGATIIGPRSGDVYISRGPIFHFMRGDTLPLPRAWAPSHRSPRRFPCELSTSGRGVQP